MSSKIILTGELSFLNLADLLQLFGSNGSTGVLHIKSKYTPTEGLIYFVDGNPVDASSGAQKGRDALYSIFGWLEGKFEFSNEAVTREKVIKDSRMGLILEGLKMLDDGQIEKAGPVSLDKGLDKGTLPLIKGPFVDYTYVVDEESHSDGAKVTEEGKHGRWICVILKGVLEVVKESPEGPITLLRLGEGAFFGTMASFLIHSYVRSATVVAVGDVQLGVLDSQRLSTEHSRMSVELRNVAMSIDRRLRDVTNRVVEVSLGQDQIEELIKDKKQLIKEGDEDERLSVIEQGEALVVQKTDHGPLLLNKLGKKDFIGNIPFLNIGHEPYSASVFASEDLELKELDPANLRNDYDQASQMLKYLIEHTATCISVTTRIARQLKDKAKGKKAGGS
jgi:CRP-like cAMP-binding protein